MKVLRKIKHYFLGKALALNDDPFENVKVEVLFNFSAFFFLINIPYTILSFSSHPIHLISAFTQDITLFMVILILKNGKKLRLAINFFMFNFASQNLLHFFINNGKLHEQGVIFYTLFCLYAFMLIGRTWGFIVSVLVSILISIGIFNENSGFSLFNFPPEIGDPTTTQGMRYIIILPIMLNIYLVSEFVKAQNKAKELLRNQKKLVEEKNKEVTDSIKYAKRIQNALLPTEKYVERVLNENKKD